ncbi:MAG: DinB family protein [Chloroflexota bacterium]
MNKDEILDALEDERERLLEAIDGLSDEQMQEPGVTGEWSIKDLLHHVSAWEAELVKLLWQAARGEKPDSRLLNDDPVDDTNAQWQAIGRARPLDDVLDDLAAVRKQTIRRVDSLADADFEDPQRYAWLKGSPLWEWIRGDSFGHEAEHTAEIKAWRAAHGY